MIEDDSDEATELEVTVCPLCGNPVAFRSMKNGGGILSDPDVALIADWVYHSKCWDKQVEEHPP